MMALNRGSRVSFISNSTALLRLMPALSRRDSSLQKRLDWTNLAVFVIIVCYDNVIFDYFKYDVIKQRFDLANLAFVYSSSILVIFLARR